MAGEVTELPEPLREWVHERAAETDLTPSEVLARAAAAYRLLEEADETLPEPAELMQTELERADTATVVEAIDDETLAAAIDDETLAAAIDDKTINEETLSAAVETEAFRTAIDARIDDRLNAHEDTELAGRVAALETELDEKISDVRSRVIQVKRETDGKAAENHDHPELAEELARVAERVESAVETAERATSEVETMDDRVTEVADTAEAGFDNYEEILRRLNESVSDLQERVETLGSAAASQRERLNGLEAADTRRSEVEELQQEASEKAVTEAKCGSCGSTVHLGLLANPRCPHCDAPYEGIDTETGLFRAAKLTVAERPALTSPQNPRSSSTQSDSPDVGPEADDTS